MLQKYAKLEMDGKELHLLLSTEALAQICDKYGDLESAVNGLDADLRNKMQMIAELVSILANAGEDAAESSVRYTPGWVMKHSIPADLGRMSDAFALAVNLGMGVETQQGDSETDEVLEEIEKNAQSAAVV